MESQEIKAMVQQEVQAYMLANDKQNFSEYNEVLERLYNVESDIKALYSIIKSQQWFIGLGFTLLTLLVSLYKFLG